MVEGIRRGLRWLFFGDPRPGLRVDLEKHDKILDRMEREVRSAHDPITRRYVGRRHGHRRVVRS